MLQTVDYTLQYWPVVAKPWSSYVISRSRYTDPVVLLVNTKALFRRFMAYHVHGKIQRQVSISSIALVIYTRLSWKMENVLYHVRWTPLLR